LAMGRFFWCFRRINDGEFSIVSQRALNSFLHGEAPLSPDADSKIRLAFVSGPCEDRRPLEVDSVELSAIEVDRAGYHNEQIRMRGMSAAMMMMDALSNEKISKSDDEQLLKFYPEAKRMRDQRRQGVIDASPSFERRRYDAQHRWRLSEADTIALRSAVNNKARRRLV
jgi:hypothetical protein